MLTLLAMACTPACSAAVESGTGDDEVDDGFLQGEDEDVGESEDSIKGAITPPTNYGCPPGSWMCGYGCTSTDYTCA